MEKYTDLIRAKELLEKYPDLKFTTQHLGYLRFSGVVCGLKGKKENFVSERSVLELHDWRFGTNFLKQENSRNGKK